MSNDKLALFDFDGTITHRDSLREFVIFTKGKRKYYIGLLILAPVLFLYKIGLIPNWKAKEKLLIYFFRGIPLDVFQKECERFAFNHIPKILRKPALKKIDNHLKSGYRVVVVSASPENWVKVWADSRKLDCIATRLEVAGGKITGRISGKNCHGVEKVDRILQQVDISGYSVIHAYGDSVGDREMLKLGTCQFYKPFRNE